MTFDLQTPVSRKKQMTSIRMDARAQTADGDSEGEGSPQGESWSSAHRIPPGDDRSWYATYDATRRLGTWLDDVSGIQQHVISWLCECASPAWGCRHQYVRVIISTWPKVINESNVMTMNHMTHVTWWCVGLQKHVIGRDYHVTVESLKVLLFGRDVFIAWLDVFIAWLDVFIAWLFFPRQVDRCTCHLSTSWVAVWVRTSACTISPLRCRSVHCDQTPKHNAPVQITISGPDNWPLPKRVGTGSESATQMHCTWDRLERQNKQ